MGPWVVGVAQNVARSLSLSFAVVVAVAVAVAVVVVVAAAAAAATPKDYSSIERSPLLCQGRRILYINDYKCMSEKHHNDVVIRVDPLGHVFFCDFHLEKYHPPHFFGFRVRMSSRTSPWPPCVSTSPRWWWMPWWPTNFQAWRAVSHLACLLKVWGGCRDRSVPPPNSWRLQQKMMFTYWKQ